MWSLLTGSLPARTRSFCAQQKQSAIVSRDKTVPIKHENSSQEEERCINCFVAERDCGKGETEQKPLSLFFVFKCACHTNAVPKGLLKGSERVPPCGGACEVRTLLFWVFQCRQGRGPLVVSFMLALAPDIITSGKVPGQAGLGERQERVRDSQDTLRVGHELQCLQRKLGKAKWEKNPKKVG